MLDPAYIEILDTNKELRKELADEIAESNIKKKRLLALTRELDACYRAISHQDSTILAHEDEIASLKSEIISLKQRLQKALQDVEQKEKHLLTREEQQHELENKVDQLKKRIREITDKKLTQNNNSSMALPDLFVNIGAALDRVENYIGGDTSIDPINTLNGIRITITTIRGHLDEAGRQITRIVTERNQYQNLLNTTNGQIDNLGNVLQQRTQMLTLAYNNEVAERRVWWLRSQRAERRNHVLLQEKVAQQLLYRRKARQYQRCYADKGLLEYNRDRLNDRYLKWKAKEFNSRQIILNLQNNPLGNMAAIPDVMNAMAPLLAREEPYVGQESPDDYFNRISQIIAYGDALGVNAFNPAMKTNVLASKMAGRFVPPNPFNNAAGGGVVTPALFQQWLRDTYQTVMIGANRTSLKALNHEKFNTTDSPETYEKRIKPYAQGIPFADALPYLYDHLPNKLSVRMRMNAPANLNAYFQNLRTLWLECGGQVWEESEKTPLQQIPQALTIQPQRSETDEDWLQLAKDLAYTGISKDHSVLKAFIYEELQKRLGNKTAHVRKSPFTPKSAYATKKVIRKVMPKKVVSKLVRLCSNCRKAGHTKVNCPGIKQMKNVNYVYQADEKDSEEPEEEYIIEDDSGVECVEEEEEEEIVDDDDEDETINCYAVKKKWCKVEYL